MNTDTLCQDAMNLDDSSIQLCEKCHHYHVINQNKCQCPDAIFRDDISGNFKNESKNKFSRLGFYETNDSVTIIKYNSFLNKYFCTTYENPENVRENELPDINEYDLSYLFIYGDYETTYHIFYEYLEKILLMSKNIEKIKIIDADYEEIKHILRSVSINIKILHIDSSPRSFNIYMYACDNFKNLEELIIDSKADERDDMEQEVIEDYYDMYKIFNIEHMDKIKNLQNLKILKLSAINYCRVSKKQKYSVDVTEDIPIIAYNNDNINTQYIYDECRDSRTLNFTTNTNINTWINSLFYLKKLETLEIDLYVDMKHQKISEIIVFYTETYSLINTLIRLLENSSTIKQAKFFIRNFPQKILPIKIKIKQHVISSLLSKIEKLFIIIQNAEYTNIGSFQHLIK